MFVASFIPLEYLLQKSLKEIEYNDYDDFYSTYEAFTHTLFGKCCTYNIPKYFTHIYSHYCFIIYRNKCYWNIEKKSENF